jgi:hypothetical protein
MNIFPDLNTKSKIFILCINDVRNSVKISCTEADKRTTSKEIIDVAIFIKLGIAKKLYFYN